MLERGEGCGPQLWTLVEPADHYAKGAVENVAEEPSPVATIEVVFLNNRGRPLCRKGIWVGEIGPGETKPFEARCDDYTSAQSFDWRYEITYQ